MTETKADGGEVGEQRRCRWCRRPLGDRVGPGRPQLFCSQRCRQWNWVARQRSAELHLSEHELVVTRSELDELRDDLYVLTCAIDDTEADLAAGAPLSAADLRRLLDWLLTCAQPLRERELGAATPPPAISS